MMLIYFNHDLATYAKLVQMMRGEHLDAVARIAVVHPDRPENGRICECADICVEGAAGVQALTAYLAYGAR